MRTYEFTVQQSTQSTKITGTMTLENDSAAPAIVGGILNHWLNIHRLTWHEEQDDGYAVGCLLCKSQLAHQSKRGALSWCKRHQCKVSHAD